MKKKLNCILLVDDDEVTNFFHKKIIKAVDVADNILTALDGEKALDIIRKADIDELPHPELILLDINMPRMNGWEFLEEYQKSGNRKKSKVIIMLTTSLNPEDKIKAKKISAIKEFRNKPLTGEMMEQIIKEYF